MQCGSQHFQENWNANGGNVNMQTDNVLLHMQIMHIIDAKIHSICIVGEVTVFVSVEELINPSGPFVSTILKWCILNVLKVAQHKVCVRTRTWASLKVIFVGCLKFLGLESVSSCSCGDVQTSLMENKALLYRSVKMKKQNTFVVYVLCRPTWICSWANVVPKVLQMA